MTDAQTEARAIARRLEALAEHLTLQPLTHADDVDIATIREAATALAARDAELARRDMKLEASARVALKLSTENRDLRTLLGFCYDTLVELNPSNYDHDDVMEANDAAIAVILAIREQLEPEQSPEP